MANKYYLDPSRAGGQPVQELYDTINYLSGMSASGTASTTTIVYDTQMEFTNNVIFSCPTTFSKENTFTGNSTFSGNVSLKGENELSGTLETAPGSILNIAGEINSSGTNTFSGKTSFTTNPVTISNGLNVSGPAKFIGSVSYSDTIDSTGTTNLNGTQNLGGSTTNITSRTLNISAQTVFNNDVTSNKKLTVNNELQSNSLYVKNNIRADGSITGSQVFGSVFNDYAEFFPRSGYTEPGDIISLDMDSEKEAYKRASAGDKLLIGVHSNQFSHLIGGENPPEGRSFVEYNINKYIPVGLAGRVKVKVLAPIEKGDKITISAVPGVGKRAEYGDQIIGYALENYDDDLNIGMVNMKII